MDSRTIVQVYHGRHHLSPAESHTDAHHRGVALLLLTTVASVALHIPIHIRQFKLLVTGGDTSLTCTLVENSDILLVTPSGDTGWEYPL